MVNATYPNLGSFPWRHGNDRKIQFPEEIGKLKSPKGTSIAKGGGDNLSPSRLFGIPE
jgi:hypothetical protein